MAELARIAQLPDGDPALELCDRWFTARADVRAADVAAAFSRFDPHGTDGHRVRDGLAVCAQFDLVAVIKQWNRRRQYREMVSKGYNPFEHAPTQRPGQPPPPPDPRQEQIMNFRGAILEAVARHDLPTAAHLYLQLKQLDPQQALPKPAQLDVANQLAGEQRYPEAAEAYESLLKVYPKAEQIEQIELMLGLIYSRYLDQYDKAKHFLQRAMLRLHEESALSLAREELNRIEPLTGPKPA